MLEDITSASSSIHINQFGFRPGLVGDAFAEALIEKAADGIPSGSSSTGRLDPERGARALYERLAAAGIEVCVVRATQLRAPVGPLGGGGTTRWNLSGLGHVDHHKVVIVDGRVGWVGGAGIEDTSTTAASTTCSYAPPGRSSRGAAPLSRQLPLARGLGSSDELDGLFTSSEAGADAVPAVVLHNAPRQYRPITAEIARLLERARDARRGQPVRHRPGDDPADRARRSARRARPPLRSCQREQLGLRGRTAVPPCEAAGCRRRHSRVPGDAAHAKLSCPMERSFSSGRAISRPGA